MSVEQFGGQFIPLSQEQIDKSFGAISDYAEQAWGVRPQTVDEVEFFAHMVCKVKDQDISALPYGHTVKAAKNAAANILNKDELEKPNVNIPNRIIKHLTENSTPSLKKAAAAIESSITSQTVGKRAKEMEKARKEIQEDFVKNIVKDVKPPPIIVGDIVAVIDASKNLPRYLQVKNELRILESELKGLENSKNQPSKNRSEQFQIQADLEKINYLKSEIALRKEEIGLLKQEGAAGALGALGLLSGSSAQVGGAGVTLAQTYTHFVAPHLPAAATHVSSPVMAQAAAQLGAIVAGGAIGIGILGSAAAVNSMIDTRMLSERLSNELNKLKNQYEYKPITILSKNLIELRKNNIESHQKSNIKKDVWKHRLTLAMYVTCIAVGSLLLAGVACTPYGILAIGLTAAIAGGIMWKRKRNKYMQGDMGKIVALQTEILQLQQVIKKVSKSSENVKLDALMRLNNNLQVKQNELKKMKIKHKLDCEISPNKKDLVDKLFEQIDGALPESTKETDSNLKMQNLNEDIYKLEQQLEGIEYFEKMNRDPVYQDMIESREKIESLLTEKRDALAALGPPLNHVELILELEDVTGLNLNAFKKDEFSERDKTELKAMLGNWITNTDTNYPDFQVSKKDFVLNKLKMAIS